MASALSQRLRRLGGKLRPDRIQYIIAAPPVCQTVEEWIEKYTPRPRDGQEEVLAGDSRSASPNEKQRIATDFRADRYRFDTPEHGNT